MYFLRVTFNDRAADQILDLPGLDREQAEAFAGEVRHEVELAGEVGAPAAEMTVPGAAAATVFEPGRIIGIDLQQQENQETQENPGTQATQRSEGAEEAAPR